MTLVFAAELPADVPTVLPVLSLVDPAPFPASLTKLTAHAMAISGVQNSEYVELRFADPWSTLRRGGHEVTLHARSGALRSRMIDTGPTSPFDLADSDAVAIAQGLADRVGLRTDEAVVSNVTHLRVAGRTIVGEPIPERILDTEVLFQRHIDGVPVDGPGGALAVRLGAAGAVHGSHLVWRDIRGLVSRVAVQSPDAVRRVFKRLAATKRGDVTVTSASLGYFEFGVDDHQSFLQPAYTIVYEVRDGDVGYRSAFVQHAGDQVFERLAGVRRFSSGPFAPPEEAAPEVRSRAKAAAPKRVSPARKTAPARKTSSTSKASPASKAPPASKASSARKAAPRRKRG